MTATTSFPRLDGLMQRELQRFRRTAHGEQKAAALDELPDLLGDVFLEGRNAREAEPLGSHTVDDDKELNSVNTPGSFPRGIGIFFSGPCANLRHPLVAALLVPTVLVIIFGIQGLIMGTMEIINAFRGGGGGSFILGAVNFLIGLLLLSSPLTAALAVPVVFGILLLVQGVALIIWALRVWRPHSKSPESAV